MKRAFRALAVLLAAIAIAGCANGTTDSSDDKDKKKDKEPAVYSVTYDGNGSTTGTAPTAQVKTEGVDLVLDANSGALARKSCAFGGWNTAADGTGTDYASGATYALNADLKLYAKWTASPTLKVGFSHWDGTPDWPKKESDSIKSAITAKNYTLLYNDASGSQANQIAALRDFIAKGVDIIIMTPAVETGWTDVLGEVKAAGIPVVLVDKTISEDAALYSAYVSYDFEGQGRKIAEALVTLKGTAPVKILELEGNTGDSATVGRKKGFDAVIAQHSSYSIVKSIPAYWNAEDGEDVTATQIAGGTVFDVVYAHNDPMAFGAITAIEAALGTVGTGAGEITIFGNDCAKVALQKILDGKIYASCECIPFLGPLSVETCEKLLTGTLKEKTIYMTDRVFTKADLTQAFVDAREY